MPPHRLLRLLRAQRPATASLDAFFRGAGLPAQRLDDKQAEQVLHRLGQLMREVVLGVTENLHLRAEQKNVMRVPTTTIQPQNNNPLKFSASVEEALNNLLFRDSAEYLSAVDAVRETFGDIKQHQQHILAALRTAVVDYVGRLDPDELENKISNGRAGALINAANKLKYWDLFKDLVPSRVGAPAGPVPAPIPRGARARVRARGIARRRLPAALPGRRSSASSASSELATDLRPHGVQRRRFTCMRQKGRPLRTVRSIATGPLLRGH